MKLNLKTGTINVQYATVNMQRRDEKEIKMKKKKKKKNGNQTISLSAHFLTKKAPKHNVFYYFLFLFFFIFMNISFYFNSTLFLSWSLLFINYNLCVECDWGSSVRTVKVWASNFKIQHSSSHFPSMILLFIGFFFLQIFVMMDKWNVLFFPLWPGRTMMTVRRTETFFIFHFYSSGVVN